MNNYTDMEYRGHLDREIATLQSFIDKERQLLVKYQSDGGYSKNIKTWTKNKITRYSNHLKKYQETLREFNETGKQKERYYI